MPALIKVNQNTGDITYSSPPNFSSSISSSGPNGVRPYDMTIGDSNHLYIASANQSVTFGGSNSHTGSLFKVTPTGSLAWSFDSGGNLYSVFYDTDSEQVIVAGKSTTTWPNSAGQTASIWVLNTSGQVVRAIALSNNDDARSAIISIDGDFYAIGNNAGEGDILTKFDKDTGSKVWEFRIVSSVSTPTLTTLSSFGKTICLGGYHATDWLSPGGISRQANGSNIWLIDFDGRVVSTANTQTGTSTDAIVQSIATRGDYIYVSTKSHVQVAGGNYYSLFKFDDALNEEWRKSAVADGDYAYRVVVDSNDNVYVSGNKDTDGNPDFGFRKYDADGDLIGGLNANRITSEPFSIYATTDDIYYFGVAGGVFEEKTTELNNTTDTDAGTTTNGSLGCGSGDIDCDDGNYLHFVIKFYSDPGYDNLVATIKSEEEPEKFFIDGLQITSDGAFICANQQASIEFRLPYDDPRDELFNQVLYAKVFQPNKNFSLFSSESDTMANVIFVIDESGSMEQEHEWLGDMIDTMETSLLDNGVGPNRYGLIGFGSTFGASYDTPARDSDPTLHYINPKFDSSGDPISSVDDNYVSGIETPWGSAAQLKAYVNQTSPANNEGVSPDTQGPNRLLTYGSLEDGYRAIHFAFGGHFDFDTNPLMVVLITDEDRFTLGSQTAETIKSLLSSDNSVLNVVVNADFIDGNGRQALGVKSDGIAVIENTDVTSEQLFEEVEGGTYVSGSRNTKGNYIDLAWDLGGIAWSLNILRHGGAAATAFTQAFVALKTEEVLDSFLCIPPISQDSFEFMCERDDDPVVRSVIPGQDINDEYSVTETVHIRYNFFSDVNRKSIVHSAFSLHDPRRFFVDNGSTTYPSDVSISGISIDPGDSVDIMYIPDILPPSYIQNQPEYLDQNWAVDKPLLCGVKYYLEIEKYNEDTGIFDLVQQIEYRTPCRTIEEGHWRDNKDEDNWISSGQGKTDFRVTRSNGQSLFPSVAANTTKQFFISWQDHRDSDLKWGSSSYKPRVYQALFDFVDDLFWSSGQGNVDKLILPLAFSPITLKDNLDNFYVVGRIDKQLMSYQCPTTELSESKKVTSCITDSKFFGIDGTGRDSSQYLIARVYEEDAKGTFVISKDDVVHMVDDCFIRLDVIGVPGSYAVRMRNEDSRDWSKWINIDTEFGSIERTDETSPPSAYSIDKERFIVPWRISPSSGLKRVCIQVMTFFGISPTFCANIMYNVKNLDYTVELFYDSELTKPVDIHDGLPITGIRSISEDSDETEIFVKFTFKDTDRLDKMKTMKRIDWGDSIG